MTAVLSIVYGLCNLRLLKSMRQIRSEDGKEQSMFHEPPRRVEYMNGQSQNHPKILNRANSIQPLTS
jgi:hypothetical protein